jgi:hypothetical protein
MLVFVANLQTRLSKYCYYRLSLHRDDVLIVNPLFPHRLKSSALATLQDKCIRVYRPFPGGLAVGANQGANGALFMESIVLANVTETHACRANNSGVSILISMIAYCTGGSREQHETQCLPLGGMARLGRQCRNDDPGYESRLQAVLKGLSNKTYSNATEASRSQNVRSSPAPHYHAPISVPQQVLQQVAHQT